MGLFDFVKEAGKSVSVATNMGKELSDLGHDPEEFEVHFDDGIVSISGEVNTQEEKEKIILALGNIEGVGQVRDAISVLEPEEEEPEVVFYTVQPGDSLSKIAKAHYGNPGQYMIIFEANQPMLDSPDKIYPGQVLRIPAQ